MAIIRETSSGYTPIPEEDILLTSRRIFLTDEVNSRTSAKLIKQLMTLDQEGDGEITVFINSPGGDVLSGLAVYDFIKTMRSPVSSTRLCQQKKSQLKRKSELQDRNRFPPKISIGLHHTKSSTTTQLTNALSSKSVMQAL